MSEVNKIRVEFTIKAVQYLDWRKDEMDEFNYDNLESNLDADADSTLKEICDIISVEVNDEPVDF